MDSGAAGSAFVSGRVDAAVTWEPWLSKSSARDGARLLASTARSELVIVDVLGFRPEVLRSRADDVRAVVQAWNDAVAFWRRDPAEAARLMAPHYGLSAEGLAAMTSGLTYLDIEASRELMGTAAEPGRLLDLVDAINRVFLKNGITQAAHALGDIVSTGYL